MRAPISAAVGLGLVLGLSLLGVASPAAAADPVPQDYPISVQVLGPDGQTDPGSAPADGGGPGLGGPGSFGSGSSGTGSDGGEGGTGSGPTGSAAGGAKSPTGSGPALGVAGIRLGWRWSIDPAAGGLDTSVTLTNRTTRAYTVGVRGWLTNLLDRRIGSGFETRVRLEPGTSRTVRLPLDGVGQWGLVTAHVTVTPPRKVDGAAMSPVSREQSVFLPPWFLLTVLAAGIACGIPLVRIIRRRPSTVVATA